MYIIKINDIQLYFLFTRFKNLIVAVHYMVTII